MTDVDFLTAREPGSPLAGLVSAEASLPGLQRAAFSWCPPTAESEQAPVSLPLLVSPPLGPH